MRVLRGSIQLSPFAQHGGTLPGQPCRSPQRPAPLAATTASASADEAAPGSCPAPQKASSPKQPCRSPPTPAPPAAITASASRLRRPRRLQQLQRVQVPTMQLVAFAFSAAYRHLTGAALQITSIYYSLKWVAVLMQAHEAAFCCTTRRLIEAAP